MGLSASSRHQVHSLLGWSAWHVPPQVHHWTADCSPQWLHWSCIQTFDTRDTDDQVQLIGFGGWFTFTPELIAARNESIRQFWNQPGKREQQSAKLKVAHRNHDPEVNAKRSIAISKALMRPETRAKLSANATAMWARRRAANAS